MPKKQGYKKPLRGGNAMNRGTASKSAKFVAPKAKRDKTSSTRFSSPKRTKGRK